MVVALVVELGGEIPELPGDTGPAESELPPALVEGPMEGQGIEGSDGGLRHTTILPRSSVPSREPVARRPRSRLAPGRRRTAVTVG